MIAQIEGKLVDLTEMTGLVQVGAICYEVMLPGYAISRLSGKIGSDVTLCTMEYYEGSPGGGNFIPRMVGFLSQGEKQFFGRYTSVKGLGIKKGLKSLTIPIATIAGAIERGDDKMLTSLPGIGKRFSQQIIAQLQGKLSDYALDSGGEASASGSGFKPYQLEAMEILVAWGEKRNEAMELIELTCKKHADIKSAEELVPLVYRIKQGIEV